jgi:adenylosuccinate lyase
MPHKVNPIDFENCEGNLGFANSIMDHFSSKLPISRMQRDLSDSTVLRNQGLAFGYSLLGFKSLMKGFDKLEVNQEWLRADLESHYEVVT